MVGTLVTLLAAAGVLALLLQPFQVRAVRMLEGYWDRWRPTAGLADVLIEIQRRRLVALEERATGPVRNEADRRMRADAGRRRTARPSVDALLPTALGNALRTGELSAGERYGLSTLASWPRIYMQVSDRMSDTLRSTRDALDTAVNLCWSFLAVTVVSASALYDEPNRWWLCGGALLSAGVSYKGAVTVAQAYSGLMHVVYDLHRFELLEALRHPLPSDGESEREAFAEVTARFSGRVSGRVRYEHGESCSGPDYGDEGANPQHMHGDAD
ncbi:hypothetical protein [Streptomyces sp. RG80]|uniref:hypothetical protein n=1 Tax=Streptomyces sp. RG80 TaxID=3157340 RepID=UPI00338E3939